MNGYTNRFFDSLEHCIYVLRVFYNAVKHSNIEPFLKCKVGHRFASICLGRTGHADDERIGL